MKKITHFESEIIWEIIKQRPNDFLNNLAPMEYQLERTRCFLYILNLSQKSVANKINKEMIK